MTYFMNRILMNGFEDDFVPQGRTFTAKRKKARATLLNLANKLLGVNLGDDTLILGTSGRYEFKNKGINVYLEALNRLKDCFIEILISRLLDG
mgnify:CR=1 FL=1